MKRTTTRSLLLRQRRGKQVMAVRTPISRSQQAACAISRDNSLQPAGGLASD